ncbi:fibronectin type III domain-containing protein, partial [Patescibacteria group bacterium]|nr:fibronectin type III domain-containing protein [Patescibacteria group bacterium]
KTEFPSISKIVYNGQIFLDGFITTDHLILLSDLTPDTEYTFQVGEQTNEGQFRTSVAGRQGQEQRQEQTQPQREMQDFFDRVPGGLITMLILLVLVGGSILFLIIRIRR